jgi:ubiquinone/menaquinone biosynthesis C-methylase UbiE
MTARSENKYRNPWPPEVIPEVYFEGFDHWYSSLNINRIETAIKDVVTNSGNEFCLDVNFGNPFMLRVLNKVFKKKLGYYISTERLKLNSDSGEIDYVEGDCYSMPFEDSTFNLVSSYAFLHLIPDHKSYFTEAFRVLKPGGCFFSDGDKNLLITRILRFYNLIYYKIKGNSAQYIKWKSLLRPKANFHQEGVDIRYIKKLLIDSGFSKVKVAPWITMKPEYQDRILVRLIINTLKFLRLNFLFTHVQIVAYK